MIVSRSLQPQIHVFVRVMAGESALQQWRIIKHGSEPMDKELRLSAATRGAIADNVFVDPTCIAELLARAWTPWPTVKLP